MYHRGFHEPPELPQISEFGEVQQALKDGVDLLSGYRHIERLPATHDVDGILLPRPFKIVRIGPVSLFVKDVDAAEAFYRDTLGFIPTEVVIWQGHRCVFMRANTEHHSLALYPLALRERLGFSPHTTCMALGLQLANYQQLRDAVRFLADHGARVTNAVPPELYPHGLCSARFRSGRPLHPALLLYGTGRMGRKAAAQGASAQTGQR